jgi:hypothetical protein
VTEASHADTGAGALFPSAVMLATIRESMAIVAP